MPKNPLSIAVGNRIAHIRNTLHLNQEEFADRLGIDRTYVCKMENGTQNLTIMKLCKLCENCNMSINDFFADEVFKTHFFDDKEDDNYDKMD